MMARPMVIVPAVPDPPTSSTMGTEVHRVNGMRITTQQGRVACGHWAHINITAQLDVSVGGWVGL